MSLRMLLPWLAAAVTLLVVWFLPLPTSIFGEEQLAAQHMPETRATATAAIDRFQTAKRAYYDFIGTHDMAAISQTLHSNIAALKSNPSDQAALASLRDMAGQVRDYTKALYGYAKAGDDLFPVLQYYDDQLMSFTRSETPPNDTVRAMTYPIADVTREYPPPVGDLHPDPPWIKSDAIKAQLDSVSSHVDQLGSANGANVAALAEGVNQDVKNIWESGRSVEQLGLDHTKYLQRLQTYDDNITAYLKNGGGDTSLSQGRKALALALNVLVGLALAGGVAFLLMPRTGQLGRRSAA